MGLLGYGYFCGPRFGAYRGFWSNDFFWFFGLKLLFSLFLLALFIYLIVWVIKKGALASTEKSVNLLSEIEAEALRELNSRYVKGEIDEETYRKMKNAIISREQTK